MTTANFLETTQKERVLVLQMLEKTGILIRQKNLNFTM